MVGKTKKIKEDSIMSLTVNTNMAAIYAHNYLATNDTAMTSAMEKLSSGYRINSASDDAAGLAISNSLSSQTAALTVASQNTSEASAMIGIAEGSADQIESILQRMQELATEAASANTGSSISATQAEFSSLQSEITRIVQSTQYQGTSLIDGTFGTSLDTNTANSTLLTATTIDAAGISVGSVLNTTGTITVSQTGAAVTISDTQGDGSVVSQTVEAAGSGVQTLNFGSLGISLTTESTFSTTGGAGDTLTGNIALTGNSATFQVGANNDAGVDSINVSLGNLSLTALGLNASDLNSQADAEATLTALTNTALPAVNNVLGTIGATTNRLTYAYNNLQSTIQNYTASDSAIKDVDMASEMTTYTKEQILEQAGTAMLAQANSSSQNILTLFK
jgi:flagellin